MRVLFARGHACASVNCSMRHPLVQFGGYDTPLTRGTWSVQVLHKDEEVYYAFVKSSRFGVYRWSYKLHVRVFSAGRF